MGDSKRILGRVGLDFRAHPVKSAKQTRPLLHFRSRFSSFPEFRKRGSLRLIGDDRILDREHIYRIIKSRSLTQTDAGAILGIQQPHVSALMRNRSGNFSGEPLIDFLIALGQDVEITVRPT